MRINLHSDNVVTVKDGKVSYPEISVKGVRSPKGMVTKFEELFNMFEPALDEGYFQGVSMRAMWEFIAIMQGEVIWDGPTTKLAQLKRSFTHITGWLAFYTAYYPKGHTMTHVKNNVVDFVTNTKESTVNITTKTASKVAEGYTVATGMFINKATDNVVTSKVNDFRIRRLISKIEACTTVEEEMPFRRQLKAMTK